MESSLEMPLLFGNQTEEGQYHVIRSIDHEQSWTAILEDLKLHLKEQDNSIDVKEKMWGMALNSDSSKLVMGMWDGPVCIVCLTSRRIERTIEAHKSHCRAVATTPDDRYFISVSDDRTGKVWSMDSYECVAVLTGHTDRARAVIVTLDSKFIVTGSDDKTLIV